MSHSKRNTSRPVFTSHERNLAKASWHQSSARLNRDSFLPFGSCGLCLEIARDPVTCSRGDIFCRECALANILTQKKELKRASKARRDAQVEDEKNESQQQQEDQARAVKDFEDTQAGMRVSSIPTQKKILIGNSSYSDIQDPRDGEGTDGKELVLANAPGTKRKLPMDEEDVERVVKEDRAKARKAIEQEKASKSESLPFFWSPSLTPDVRDSKLEPTNKKAKESPVCPTSTDSNTHPFSMQKLITVNFNEQEDAASKEKTRSCPSCLKVLTNASTPIMAKRCGHVMCSRCVKQFLLPTGKHDANPEESIITCYVCDEPVTVKSSSESSSSTGLPVGLVALKSEGTGFSAKGTSTVKKSGVGFQC